MAVTCAVFLSVFFFLRVGLVITARPRNKGNRKSEPDEQSANPAYKHCPSFYCGLQKDPSENGHSIEGADKTGGGEDSDRASSTRASVLRDF